MKRAALIAEFFFIFIGLPFFIYLDVVPIPKIPTLLVLTLGCLIYLILSKSFQTKSLLSIDLKDFNIWSMFGKFVLAFAGMAIVVWFLDPDNFFIFPRLRFSTWLFVMFLYPIFSALPQELVYRSFFFHRYKDLFSTKFTLIAASASTFGYLHIIYDNWIALGMTLAGGILFSLTYYRTKSLLIASLEHALYGCAVFTVGLGSYFFEPFNP